MTKLRKVSISLAVLSAITLVLGWIFLMPVVRMGTGYAAKQVCSCVYVGGRHFDDCAADLRRYGPSMSVIPIEGLDGVRAEVFPLARATAYAHDPGGCTQE